VELVQRVSRKFADLSPQLQLAARFVIDHPDEIATHSLRQIAKQSGLSAPTYSRLARAIGYDEYEALRDTCRESLKQTQLTLAERAALVQTSGEPMSSSARGSFAARHAATVASSINAMVANLDPDALADVADRLAAAQSVRLAGSQSSGAMVDYIHHIASLASANWSIVGRNGSSASSDLADVNGETVLLSISVSPYLRRTLQITETAAAVGATVVAITDDVRSPILRFSHHSFIVPTDSLQFFPSHVSILTLLEILGGMVVRRLGHQANSRIDRVEQLSRAVGDYVE